jgi:regulatory protein
LKPLKSHTVDEAKRALEHFCSYQERCHKEVMQKLYDLRMIPQAQELIILHLLEHNFLNEERYAKTYARGKFSIKKWGKIRIVKELKFRNISAYNINVALKEIDPEDYIDMLQKLCQKKFLELQESDSFKKRKKLIDYLLRKGYECDLIYQTIRSLKLFT